MVLRKAFHPDASGCVEGRSQAALPTMRPMCCDLSRPIGFQVMPPIQYSLKPGDFKASHIGVQPVLVTRDAEDQVHVVLNRCAHRGSMVCAEGRGNTERFVCPYHGWSYDRAGKQEAVDHWRKGVAIPATVIRIGPSPRPHESASSTTKPGGAPAG